MTLPGARHPAWHASLIRLYLHQLRKQYGLSQSDAATQIGYGTAALNAWERGYTAPSFVQLTEWASIFDLQVLLTPRVGNARLSGYQQEQRARIVAEMRGLHHEASEHIQDETKGVVQVLEKRRA